MLFQLQIQIAKCLWRDKAPFSKAMAFFFTKKTESYIMFLFQKNFFIKTPKRSSPNWGAFFLTKNNDSAIIIYHK